MRIQAKMDQQGRITIPKAIRDAAAFEPGSERMVEFDYDTGSIVLRPVVNPFDILALDTLRQYEAGETIPLSDIAREAGIDLDDER